MSAGVEPITGSCILATVVLYRRSAAESQSLLSLLQILGANPNLAEQFSLAVYDNSPEQHPLELSANIPVIYTHQPANAGLAAAYNFALQYAEQHGQEWLLLLDQDSTLSLGFLSELIECVTTLREQHQVASIVPKITAGSRIQSPVSSFLIQLRHQHKRFYNTVSDDLAGIQPGGLTAYNSGAALRVAALRSIGGFPEEFWLDYLDYAVFHALAIAKYQMYIMRAHIEHEPSQANLSDVPEWRQRNILLAQTLFVKRAGTPVDRMLYRLWILRYSAILWMHSPHRRLWKEALLQAVFLRTQNDRLLKS
jgi:GT2 family glycosyltransferase